MRKSESNSANVLAVVVCVIAASVTGCRSHEECYERPSLAPLGAVSDPIWQDQETNAEASQFVVHQHEFKKDVEWLKRIPAEQRLVSGKSNGAPASAKPTVPAAREKVDVNDL